MSATRARGRGSFSREGATTSSSSERREGKGEGRRPWTAPRSEVNLSENALGTRASRDSLSFLSVNARKHACVRG